jgi:UDP-N-acetyl-2-amino-2-deoxyglucuronate dehydrogenase
MGRIGVGIVGLGNAVKPHAAALAALAERVEVVGGWSPSAERRARFASTYALPVADSLEALLADPAVEALFVLTPPRTHTGIALAAARAGKDVLLEKPVDVDYARSKALVDAVEDLGRTFGVVFQHRFREASIALRETLRGGALGELLSVSASIRWWRSDEYFAEPGRGTIARDGGGVLLTQAIHTLDLMLDLAGPPARVSALVCTSPLRAIDTEDIACATVQYRDGAVGVIDATTVAYPGYPERVEIAGTKGSAVLAAERLELNLRDAPARVIDGGSAGGGGADPMAFSPDAHRRLIADFLDAVEARRQPQASARSALAIHALIDAMLESSRTGVPVDVVASI